MHSFLELHISPGERLAPDGRLHKGDHPPVRVRWHAGSGITRVYDQMGRLHPFWVIAHPAQGSLRRQTVVAERTLEVVRERLAVGGGSVGFDVKEDTVIKNGPGPTGVHSVTWELTFREPTQVERGYEPDPCPKCDLRTMIRNGTCLKCVSCGATSGCS